MTGAMSVVSDRGHVLLVWRDTHWRGWCVAWWERCVGARTDNNSLAGENCLIVERGWSNDDLLCMLTRVGISWKLARPRGVPCVEGGPGLPPCKRKGPLLLCLGLLLPLLLLSLYG